MSKMQNRSTFTRVRYDMYTFSFNPCLFIFKDKFKNCAIKYIYIHSAFLRVYSMRSLSRKTEVSVLLHAFEKLIPSYE